METLEIMNAFVNNYYDWRYTSIVKQKKMKKMTRRILMIKILSKQVPTATSAMI